MSDLEKRNAAAVQQALTAQNVRLDEFFERLMDMNRQITMLAEEFNQLKAKSLADIAARFDGGPTA